MADAERCDLIEAWAREALVDAVDDLPEDTAVRVEAGGDDTYSLTVEVPQGEGAQQLANSIQSTITVLVQSDPTLGDRFHEATVTPTGVDLVPSGDAGARSMWQLKLAVPEEDEESGPDEDGDDDGSADDSEDESEEEDGEDDGSADDSEDESEEENGGDSGDDVEDDGDEPADDSEDDDEAGDADEAGDSDDGDEESDEGDETQDDGEDDDSDNGGKDESSDDDSERSETLIEPPGPQPGVR